MARVRADCVDGFWQHPKTYEQIMTGCAPVTYNLTAYDPLGGSMQDIELTRKEYLKLQRRLCKLRKLKPAEASKSETAPGKSQEAE